LALAYHFGQGVKKDAQQSTFWLEKAVQAGQPEALAAWEALEKSKNERNLE
jgi:TPR repeat protein